MVLCTVRFMATDLPQRHRQQRIELCCIMSLFFSQNEKRILAPKRMGNATIIQRPLYAAQAALKQMQPCHAPH